MYRESVVRWGLFATILALSLLSVVTDQAAFVLAITVLGIGYAFARGVFRAPVVRVRVVKVVAGLTLIWSGWLVIHVWL